MQMFIWTMVNSKFMMNEAGECVKEEGMSLGIC